MREIRSYGSVGEREGNDPLYPDMVIDCIPRRLAALSNNPLLFLRG